MQFKLKCKCGATCWVLGTYEADTNATLLDESKVYKWDGGTQSCPHDDDDFEIVDEDYVSVED